MKDCDGGRDWEGWGDSGGSDDLVTHPCAAQAAALCALQEGLVSRQSLCLQKKGGVCPFLWLKVAPCQSEWGAGWFWHPPTPPWLDVLKAEHHRWWIFFSLNSALCWLRSALPMSLIRWMWEGMCMWHVMEGKNLN